MKLRRVEREDVKVGAVIYFSDRVDDEDILDYGYTIKKVVGQYVVFAGYEDLDRSYTVKGMLKLFIRDESPTGIPTFDGDITQEESKVMTYIGGTARYAADGKNYNVAESEKHGRYKIIGDDGNEWHCAKECFIDPADYRGITNPRMRHFNGLRIDARDQSQKQDQIGGDHYNKNDPIQFARDNYPPEQLEGFFRINVDKYVARYDKKNGLEDLKKARHYLNMLIELKEKADAE